MSPCQPGMWNRVTLPQCSPEWELGHCWTKEEKGAYGLETTPPPWSVKHSSPNIAQGSYPHWSAGNGSSPRQCPSPPARSLLNWPSMQWVARVEESACWIEGSVCRRQVFVCFCYNRPLLSSEELIPPPPPFSCAKVWPSVIDTYFNVVVQAAHLLVGSGPFFLWVELLISLNSSPYLTHLWYLVKNYIV